MMQEGLQNQSVQELENYAAYKAEETTHKVNDCLKIAQVIREDASDTLVMLHQQGEQITRTHETTVSIDHDLSRVCSWNLSETFVMHRASKFNITVYGS